tara:strand:- start:235 stop:753 length:519 start_codon:yes stop_codon:yes gene_type:complete
MDKWFAASATYDDYITTTFKSTLKMAEGGHLIGWTQHRDSFVALIVLLDQFSRHIYRGNANAFQNDSAALTVATAGIDVYYDQLNKYEKLFVLMPFTHAENVASQQKGLQYINSERTKCPDDPWWKEVHQHAIGHLHVIKTFARFPKRNRVLGRRSTPAEIQYMNEFPDRPY